MSFPCALRRRIHNILSLAGNFLGDRLDSQDEERTLRPLLSQFPLFLPFPSSKHLEASEA